MLKSGHAGSTYGGNTREAGPVLGWDPTIGCLRGDCIRPLILGLRHRRTTSLERKPEMPLHALRRGYGPARLSVHTGASQGTSAQEKARANPRSKPYKTRCLVPAFGGAGRA